MCDPEATRVVVYGDLETVTTHQERVTTLSAQDNLEIVGWFHDPEGLRPISELSEAPGLVGALAECARTEADLHIPFLVDAPGEQRWRLIAHWLHTHGLRLLTSGKEYVWDSSTDAIDLGVRRTLDSASNLAVAVVATGALPSMEDLLVELLADREERGGAAPTTGVGLEGGAARRQPGATGRAEARERGNTDTVSDVGGPWLLSDDAPSVDTFNDADAHTMLRDAAETIRSMHDEIELLSAERERLQGLHRNCAFVPVPPVINAEAVLAALSPDWRRALEGAAIAVAPAGTLFFQSQEDKAIIASAHAIASELETLHRCASEAFAEAKDLGQSDVIELALSFYEVASRSVDTLVELLDAEP
jgi:hypothetical protein